MKLLPWSFYRWLDKSPKVCWPRLCTLKLYGIKFHWDENPSVDDFVGDICSGEQCRIESEANGRFCYCGKFHNGQLSKSYGETNDNN